MDTPLPQPPKRREPKLVDYQPGMIKRRKRQRRVIRPEKGSARAAAMLPGGASASSPLVNVHPNEYVPPHLWSVYKPGPISRATHDKIPMANVRTAQLKGMADRMGYTKEHPMPDRKDKPAFRKWLEGLYLAHTKRKQEWVMDRHNTESKMAAIVISKFGGVRGMADALKRLHLHSGDPKDKQYIRHRNTITNWRIPSFRRGAQQHNGTDGTIPYPMWRPILRAARYEGILLKFEDFFPELA